MTHKQNAVLKSYLDLFREVVNTRIRSSDEGVRELLGLNKDDDWGFVCAAMDLVGDTNSAIDNFLRFGLDGPTKYRDTGEKYLRLYGMLNATYVQQEAVWKLYSAMKVPGVDEVRTSINRSEIRRVRIHLAAHGAEVINRVESSKRAFAPVRIRLAGFTCAYMDFHTNERRNIDLRSELASHVELITNLLDVIAEWTLQRVFKNDEEHRSCFARELELLRLEKAGHSVLRAPGQEPIVMRKFDEAI